MNLRFILPLTNGYDGVQLSLAAMKGMQYHAQDCNDDAQLPMVWESGSVALHISLYNVARQAEPQLYHLTRSRSANTVRYIK